MTIFQTFNKEQKKYLGAKEIVWVVWSNVSSTSSSLSSTISSLTLYTGEIPVSKSILKKFITDEVISQVRPASSTRMRCS